MKKLFLFLLFLVHNAYCQDTVTIAILAKDKAHTLELYLQCIEQQTWPKKATNLYIRTNNNTDATAQILKQWLEKVHDDYALIFFDESDVAEPVQEFKQHEWNWIRFKVLGKIRQESVQWAFEHNCHYFVADCDNFIQPTTIETLIKTQLPVVAPFLRTGNSYYSNYHAAIDKNGYFENCDLYYQIYNNQVTGLIQVPVVHCTYFIRKEYLPFVCYDDESYRYEYVIFSDVLRQNGIEQYIDNRQLYGRISSAETSEDFCQENWLSEFGF